MMDQILNSIIIIVQHIENDGPLTYPSTKYCVFMGSSPIGTLLVKQNMPI